MPSQRRSATGDLPGYVTLWTSNAAGWLGHSLRQHLQNSIAAADSRQSRLRRQTGAVARAEQSGAGADIGEKGGVWDRGGLRKGIVWGTGGVWEKADIGE